MKYTYTTNQDNITEVTLKMGDRYKINLVDTVYLLSKVSPDKFSLINLKTGDRFFDPTTLIQLALLMNQYDFVPE